MIQKCPNCGRWCESTDSNILERGINRLVDSINDCSEFGGKYLGNIGKGVGAAVGTYTGLGAGLSDALFGDKYQFLCSECGHKWSCDDEDEDQTDEYEYEQEIIDLVLSVKNCKETDRNLYISKLRSKLSEMDSSQIGPQAMLYDALAYCSFAWNKDSAQAIIYINDSINLTEDPNSITLKGIFRGECRTAGDYYVKLRELLSYRKTNYENPFYTKAYIEDLITETSVKYSEEFLSIPYPQRKFLIIDSELNYLPEKSFKVLQANQIPTDIKFLEGPYVEKSLYICHPYKKNHYIPFDNYQEVLLKEEVRQLHILLQGLGAKNVSIDSDNSNEGSEKSKTGLGGKIGGSYKGVGANVGGEIDKENDSSSMIKKHLTFNAVNEQRSKPHIVQSEWYDYMEEWQDMAKLRMGGQLTYNLVLSSSQVNFVSSTEMQQLSVDFNALVASGNVEGHHSEEKEFKASKQNSWRIDVEFYPLSSYNEEKEIISNQPSSHAMINKNKMNYILIAIIVLLGFVIGFLLLS